MKTKIFCDSADFQTIKKLNNNPLVDGFTTNPSLMRKAGAKDYKKYSQKILKICRKKPISLEVFGDTDRQMLRQAEIINSWVKTGKIEPINPYHLIFSIWATTQHYADFDVQIQAVVGNKNSNLHFDDAKIYLRQLFTRLLEPKVKLKEPLP